MLTGTIRRQNLYRLPGSSRGFVAQGKNHGFSLIELLIAILIIGVLSQTALPQFGHYITKQRRADGQALLRENSALLQECLAIGGIGYDECDLRLQSAEGYYSLLDNRTATTYVLSAVPTNKDSQHLDTECEALILTQDRLESATGTHPESCW